MDVKIPKKALRLENAIRTFLAFNLNPSLFYFRKGPFPQVHVLNGRIVINGCLQQNRCISSNFINKNPPEKLRGEVKFYDCYHRLL